MQAVLPPDGVAITGSAPGGVRISIWENGKYLASAPVAPDGSWSWQANRTFTPGRHVIRLFAADAANVHSDRSEVVFTVDPQAPRYAPAPTFDGAAAAGDRRATSRQNCAHDWNRPMADQAKHTRRIFNGVDTTGAVPIEYRFSHSRNGNRHLVVAFANFTAPDEYGWSNGVLDKVRGNVLWIRDLFEGANTYYLCKRMDFSLERSVAALIERVMRLLHLTPQDVTLFGSSKGGSAALFFGLKYGYGNIVAVVPQFSIGSYVRAGIPGAAKVMMGEVTEQNVAVLDAVLPDLVIGSPHRNANIYLITSPQDEQYVRQVQPFVRFFQGYSNFNFIYTDSALITDHGKVTLRNLPTIMGILNMLVDGIVPYIGMITNGGEVLPPDHAAIDQFLKETSQVRGTPSPAR
ncbi:hypothetical protein ACFQ2M_10390 [Kitasatospora saccharophila]|uniref:hypothetical protein n=1 Tax=Kitasatospora saccharophila TaxID=407973 RepID=UPI003635F305